MALALFSQDSREIALPAGYLVTPKLRDVMPGSTLKGNSRLAHLEAMGITEDSAPNSLIRHLLPKDIKKNEIAAIRAAYGDDAAECAVEFKQCPALVELGIVSADSYNNQVANGQKNAAGTLLRTSSIPCPHCLGAALIADIKNGAIVDKMHAAIVAANSTADSDTE